MSDMTYRELQNAVTVLGEDVARTTQEIHSWVRGMNKRATDTARVADQIAVMKVDTATIGETRQLSKIITGASDAGTAYVAAGDTTVKVARAVWEQAHLTHDRINEAVNRSTAAGIHDVDNHWFQQE